MSAATTFLRHAPALGLPDDPRQLRTEHFDRYAVALRKAGNRPVTVGDRVNGLSNFFAFLVQRGIVTRNPLAGRRLRPESEPVAPFSASEVQALMDVCSTRNWQGARDLAILWTLLDTGLRASELVGLDLADLDRQEWQLKVRQGKGGKFRTARLGNAARRYVGDFLILWRGDEDGPLFAGRKGRLTPHGLLQVLYRLGRAAQVANAHPHRLRHTFAVEFLRAGGDVFRLQMLLGHSSLEMTRRYTAYLSMEDALAGHEVAGPGDALGLRAPRRGVDGTQRSARAADASAAREPASRPKRSGRGQNEAPGR